MAGFSLFGNSGDKTNVTNVTTTNNTDSFNRTFTSTRAFSDVGNTVFNYGPQPSAGAAGVIASLGPYVIAGALIFGGIVLMNRKS